MKRLLIILSVCLIFAACQKQDLQQYTEKPRVYLSLSKSTFYAPFPNSIATNVRIDYAPQKSSKVTDTLKLNVQISGPAATVDRTFALERNGNEGNAVEGVDYDVLDKGFLIPAGLYSTIVRVVIRRNANMAKQAVNFSYALKENENFELGPQSDTARFSSNSGIVSITRLKVTATDVLNKPDNWDSFIFKYFGVYSNVKHRFIVDVLAKVSFPSTTSAGVMNRNKTTLTNALKQYNETHPEKLKDENGTEISF